MVLDRHFRKLAAMLMLAAVASFSSGCKPDPAIKDPAIVGRGTVNPTPAAADPSDASPDAPAPVVAAPGGITGTIFFNGKAPGKTIDTSMDPACSMGGRPTLPTEQFVVKNGKLANVFLYVKSGPPEAMQGGTASPDPVVLDQKNCQYVPHVIGVMAGGYVEFRNSDPTMHNVHTQPSDIGNETIDISEGPRGQPQTKQFRRPELMIPVRCNNHPWMNAFINVSPTPFFAVSDANGHFDLRGLPPGTYTIGAVHEKMGEKTMQVTVGSNQVSKAEFSFALQ
jgi:plastocyanin